MIKNHYSSWFFIEDKIRAITWSIVSSLASITTASASSMIFRSRGAPPSNTRAKPAARPASATHAAVSASMPLPAARAAQLDPVDALHYE